MRQLYTLADVLVILALPFESILAQNLAMLRVLRRLRFLHSCHVLRDSRRDCAFFRRHADAALAAVNVFVFIFVTTSIVFDPEFGNGDGPGGYIDALRFTVSTLTTTGHGDITPTEPA